MTRAGSAEWCWTTVPQPHLPAPGIAGSGFASSATGRSRWLIWTQGPLGSPSPSLRWALTGRSSSTSSRKVCRGAAWGPAGNSPTPWRCPGLQKRSFSLPTVPSASLCSPGAGAAAAGGEDDHVHGHGSRVAAVWLPPPPSASQLGGAGGRCVGEAGAGREGVHRQPQVVQRERQGCGVVSSVSCPALVLTPLQPWLWAPSWAHPANKQARVLRSGLALQRDKLPLV